MKTSFYERVFGILATNDDDVSTQHIDKSFQGANYVSSIKLWGSGQFLLTPTGNVGLSRVPPKPAPVRHQVGGHLGACNGAEFGLKSQAWRPSH